MKRKKTTLLTLAGSMEGKSTGYYALRDCLGKKVRRRKPGCIPIYSGQSTRVLSPPFELDRNML